MNERFDFGAAEDRRIVYVRSVKVADLPEEVREQASGIDTLYAVHAEDGEHLALVRDRQLAFVLARQNDEARPQPAMSPIDSSFSRTWWAQLSTSRPSVSTRSSGASGTS
ncbi:MAG: DUF1150 family protein [Rhodosalinus sp.]